MENATKALLIAAAVLVVIVIIALGVRLLGAAGDSSTQAKEVSETLTTTTEKAATEISTGLSTLVPGSRSK